MEYKFPSSLHDLFSKDPPVFLNNILSLCSPVAVFTIFYVDIPQENLRYILAVWAAMTIALAFAIASRASHKLFDTLKALEEVRRENKYLLQELSRSSHGEVPETLTSDRNTKSS